METATYQALKGFQQFSITFCETYTVYVVVFFLFCCENKELKNKIVESQTHLSAAPSLPGFNPVWNETLNFVVHTPELALVRFVVEDYDKASKNDFLGQFTLPFTCIQAGELQTEHQCCTLL